MKDGLDSHRLGADIIGTTLSGYITAQTPEEPDLALVRALSHEGYCVIAEGRYNASALAAQEMQNGAWAVTVGSAVTRLEQVCQWFRDEIQGLRIKMNRR